MLKRIKNLFHIKQEKEAPSIYEKIDNLYDALNDDTILIQIGSDLVPHGEFICNIISELREEIKDECGFILPPVRILDNSYYQENEYSISILSDVVTNNFLIPTEKGIRDELYEDLKTTVYNNLDKIFTNDIMEKYIETVQRNNSWLIWNISFSLSVIEIKTIMLDIIHRGKSINNINYIFEQIGEYVLTEGKFRDCLVKHNPHNIAHQIAKKL